VCCFRRAGREDAYRAHDEGSMAILKRTSYLEPSERLLWLSLRSPGRLDIGITE